MTRPSRVIIDKSALKHNLQLVKKLTHNSKIMAIVKADAYGHGLVRVAKTLQDADAFGVSCLEEAEKLREANILLPIVLLEGPHEIIELSRIQELDLDVIIHSSNQISMLEHTNSKKKIQIWLKIDTGMHRLGLSPFEFKEAMKRLEACSNVKNGINIMTHLATANEINHPLVTQQFNIFINLCKNIELKKTIANSAAIINSSKFHLDWVRPGLMLYGVSPIKGETAIKYGLKSVMTLESELISVKNLNKGDSIGYGATWCCPKNMPIGIIAVGYGDGFPRHAKTGTPVLVNGVRCSLIGRASMDMLTVDLSNQAHAKIGDKVVLWGGELPIEEVAEHAETIPYELLCSVHKRLMFIEKN